MEMQIVSINLPLVSKIDFVVVENFHNYLEKKLVIFNSSCREGSIFHEDIKSHKTIIGVWKPKKKGGFSLLCSPPIR